MKIVYLGRQEFQLLKSTEIDRVEFQKKIFFRDVDVSKRAHQNVVNELQKRGDERTTCLIVEMEGYYTVWHEVEVEDEVPDTIVPASSSTTNFNQEMTVPSRGTPKGLDIQPVTTGFGDSLPSLIQSSPSQPVSEGGKQGAATGDFDIRQPMPPTLESASESSIESPSSDKKRRRYRGVEYEVNSENAESSIESPSFDKKRRRYRGVEY